MPRKEREAFTAVYGKVETKLGSQSYANLEPSVFKSKLSYLLEQKVQLRLLTEPNIPQIPHNLQNVFLYRPSEPLRHQLEKKYRIEPVYAHSNIWKLEN